MDIHNYKQKNDELYIIESKKNIDNYLLKHDYKRAFGLLILVLERIDDTQKTEMINYYSKNLIKLYF
jgi:hypothetical protein